MPELPEVETTRRGIEPWLVGRRIRRLVVRQPRLRWRVPAGLAARVAGARVRGVTRRAKYLLIGTDAGTLILHLGMSGSLRVLDAASPPLAHDHVDLVLDRDAVGAEVVGEDRLDGDHGRRDAALHVAGAAAPDLAVCDGAAHMTTGDTIQPRMSDRSEPGDA